MIDLLASLIQSSKFSDLIADRLDRAGWLVVLFTIEELVKACNIAHECLRDNTGQFHYPPFGFKDSKTGEFVGFDVDIIRAIGRTAGFRVKVENIPFDGLIPALKTRTIDIAINDIGITAERAKSVDFSDRYYIAGMGIVVAKGYQGIQSAKDLEGKRLAVTIGSTGEIAAKRIPHAQVRVFNTLSDCFLELINNGVDAVLNDIPTNDYYAVTAGAGKVDSLSISLAAEDLGIAVKKGRKDLLEKINKGLASLKASGEFTAIYKKWFGREPSPELLR